MSTKPMTADNIGAFIDRLYASTEPFQWLREVVANSHQAGATKVILTTEPVAMKDLGVHRRVILDDGSGMTATQMPKFLNTYGGSGRTVGSLSDNFGIGAKATLMPWNRYGMVVISRVDDEVSLLWLHQDQSDGTYGLRQFEDEDSPFGWVDVIGLHEFPEGYIIDDVNWCEVAAPLTSNGTMIVLCGDEPTQDTIKGDVQRKESTKYGIQKYLDARLWSSDMKITLGSYSAPADDRTKWPKESVAFDRPDGSIRNMRGLKDTLTLYKGKGDYLTGVWSMPVTKDNPLAVDIEWTLHHPDATVRPRSGVEGEETDLASGDRFGLPMIGVLHETHPGFPEVYELKAVNLNTIQARATVGRFVRLEQVRNRLSLIVRPKPGAGQVVAPDDKRSALVLTDAEGGRPLPWDAWVEGWNVSMPKEIRDAIVAYYATRMDGDVEINPALRRTLADHYLPYMKVKFKAPVVTKDAGTNGTGHSTGPGSNPGQASGTGQHKKQGGHRKASTPAGSGDKASTDRTIKGGLVRVTIDRYPGSTWAVSYDQQQHVALVNQSSQPYIRLVSYLLRKYTDDGRLNDQTMESAVRTEIDKVISTHVMLAVTEAIADAQDTPNTVNTPTSPTSEIALSNCLRGIRFIEMMVANPIGALLGAKPKSKVTA